MTIELAVDIMRNLLQTGLILAIPILGTAQLLDFWLVSFSPLLVCRSKR